MPWRREEVAPYCYEDRYIPDTHEKFYYSWVERTPEERDRLYHEINKIPYDDPPEPPRSFWQDRAPEPEPEPEEPKGISVMKPIQFKAKKGKGGPRHH
jgi:hypothetical protein